MTDSRTLVRVFAMVVLALVIANQTARSETIRPMFTKENRFPNQWQPELGFQLNYTQIEDAKIYSEVPYGRVGLLDNLAAYVEVPFSQYRPKSGDNEAGLGDVEAGVEFRVWEDIFSYPWVIPHASISFPTGDEDKGLGIGESVTTLGLAVGTVVNDMFHFIADGRYAILGGSKSEKKDNVASISGAFIWDISKQFSVLAEARLTNEDIPDQEGNPVYYEGGITYDATRNLMLGAYVGSSENTGDDVYGNIKAAYTF